MPTYAYNDARHGTRRVRRWLGRDPIGEKGGINLYAFVGNNAIASIDSNGLAPGANIIAALIFKLWGQTLSANFVLHYLFGFGAPYHLSYEEVKSLDMQPSVSVDRTRQFKLAGNYYAYDTLNENAGSHDNDNSLGQFTVRLRGTVNCAGNRGWRFSGDFKVYDFYDFDPDLLSGIEHERDWKGELKTWIGLLCLSGRPFMVDSDWIDITQEKGKESVW